MYFLRWRENEADEAEETRAAEELQNSMPLEEN
jgi:hypothetical protein